MDIIKLCSMWSGGSYLDLQRNDFGVSLVDIGNVFLAGYEDGAGHPCQLGELGDAGRSVNCR